MKELSGFVQGGRLLLVLNAVCKRLVDGNMNKGWPLMKEKKRVGLLGLTYFFIGIS